MNNQSIITYNDERYKNNLLRNFYYNTSDEMCLLYNTQHQHVPYTEELIIDICNKYYQAMQETNIPYFVGKLKKEQAIDYKSIQINVGTAFNQIIFFEAVSRRAIEAVGFFDVRLKYNASVIDYALRLGEKPNLYPRAKERIAPWLFDINYEDITTEPFKIDVTSSNWLGYKYQTLPWSDKLQATEDLKDALKKIKGP